MIKIQQKQKKVNLRWNMDKKVQKVPILQESKNAKKHPMVSKIKFFDGTCTWALTLWQNFCIRIKNQLIPSLSRKDQLTRTMYFLLYEVNVFKKRKHPTGLNMNLTGYNTRNERSSLRSRRKIGQERLMRPMMEKQNIFILFIYFN